MWKWLKVILGPFVLARFESLLVQMGERRSYCAASNGDSLASSGISLLLAVEEPTARASQN